MNPMYGECPAYFHFRQDPAEPAHFQGPNCLIQCQGFFDAAYRYGPGQ